MIFTIIVFLTNLILAIASIIPLVLRDNRGEIKIPMTKEQAIAKLRAAYALADILKNHRAEIEQIKEQERAEPQENQQPER